MTYEQLLDQLESMTEEQLSHKVVLLYENNWITPDVILSVNNDYSEEEGFPKGQMVLV